MKESRKRGDFNMDQMLLRNLTLLVSALTKEKYDTVESVVKAQNLTVGSVKGGISVYIDCSGESRIVFNETSNQFHLYTNDVELFKRWSEIPDRRKEVEEWLINQ